MLVTPRDAVVDPSHSSGGTTPSAPFVGRHQATQSMSGNRKIGAVSPLGWAALVGLFGALFLLAWVPVLLRPTRLHPSESTTDTTVAASPHRPPWRPAARTPRRTEPETPRPCRRSSCSRSTRPTSPRRLPPSRSSITRRSDEKKAADAAAAAVTESTTTVAGPSEPSTVATSSSNGTPVEAAPTAPGSLLALPSVGTTATGQTAGGLTSAGSLNSRRNAAGIERFQRLVGPRPTPAPTTTAAASRSPATDAAARFRTTALQTFS